MLVPPYFWKTYTRVNIEIRSKNLKLGKKYGKNVTLFLTQISYQITLFSPLFELKWIITCQYIFDIGRYTNWQKTPIISISNKL